MGPLRETISTVRLASSRRLASPLFARTRKDVQRWREGLEEPLEEMSPSRFAITEDKKQKWKGEVESPLEVPPPPLFARARDNADLDAGPRAASESYAAALT